MGPDNWGIGTLGLQLRARLAEEVRDFAPDVAHVHGLLPAGLLALGLSLPTVVTAHGSETYALPWRRSGLERLARAVVGRAQRLAAVSSFVGDHLCRLGARDVAIIPNGADDALFFPRDRPAARRSLGLNATGPVVLFVGHQEREKGMVEFVDALRELAPLGVSALFAGKGSMNEWVRAQLQQADVEATFLGSIEHDRLALAYGAADVLALPSYREGLPTVICEAMNAGRAVVATRVGGIPEIVEDGCTGLLIPAQDASALAAALREVVTNHALRSSMEAAAYERGRRTLTWNANAAAYEALYRSIQKRVPAPLGREDSLVVP